MTVRVAPVIIRAIAVAGLGASAALAQPVNPPPAPPPAPPLKSGDFSCAMHDRSGATFILRGQMGNWRSVAEGQFGAQFLLDAPTDSGLSGRYLGTVRPLEMRFSSWDAENKVSVDVRMKAGYGPDGMIMIERTKLNMTSRPTTNLFVGICDTKFSIEPRELAQ